MKIQEKQIVDPDTPLHDSVTATRSGRDAEEAKFHVGQKVRLLEDVVNDGTYPHSPIGATMMKKGAIGYIKTMGEFLQVIRVYEVHFLGYDTEVEIIGCREHELEAMEEYQDEMAEEIAFLKAHREKMNKKQ